MENLNQNKDSNHIVAETMASTTKIIEFNVKLETSVEDKVYL
jgi:hypothetical protein